MENFTVRNGNIYITSTQYETYFAGVKAAVLLKRDEGVLLMPVQNASGGLFLKIRNARGDRVLQASEFFLFNNVECQDERIIDAHWDSGMAALILNV